MSTALDYEVEPVMLRVSGLSRDEMDSGWSYYPMPKGSQDWNDAEWHDFVEERKNDFDFDLKNYAIGFSPESPGGISLYCKPLSEGVLSA